MLIPAKAKSDFSVECALPVIAHCFLVTPHHPPFANGCMPVPCLATLTAANIYSPLQYLVLAISRKAGALGILRPDRGEAMQDSGFELLRIPLPRTPVHTAPSRPVCDPFLSAAQDAALGLLRCSRGDN
jgi:hypothetical protein